MGMYWMAVNHTKKERVDPSAGWDGGVKAPCLFHPGGTIFGSVLAALMTYDGCYLLPEGQDAWTGDHVEVVPDEGGEAYYHADENYAEVGGAVLRRLQSIYPESEEASK